MRQITGLLVAQQVLKIAGSRRIDKTSPATRPTLKTRSPLCACSDIPRKFRSHS